MNLCKFLTALVRFMASSLLASLGIGAVEGGKVHGSRGNNLGGFISLHTVPAIVLSLFKTLIPLPPPYLEFLQSPERLEIDSSCKYSRRNNLKRSGTVLSSQILSLQNIRGLVLSFFFFFFYVLEEQWVRTAPWSWEVKFCNFHLEHFDRKASGLCLEQFNSFRTLSEQGMKFKTRHILCVHRHLGMWIAGI